MSRNYDNWERLVRAILRREELRQLAHLDSLSSSSSLGSNSSSFHLSDADPSPFKSSRLEMAEPTPAWVNVILSRAGSILSSWLRSSKLGKAFSYEDIVRATDNFSDQNLINRGRSGDLFIAKYGLPGPIVIKRIDNYVVDPDSFSLEVDFFSRIANGHPRFVPLLGNCLESSGDEQEKFLVYPCYPHRDLFRFYFSESPHGGFPDSLDWFRRMYIAKSVARGLVYLHNQCDPPLVHGDVQASSILLDDNFEVRLGSLSQVSVHGKKWLFTRKKDSGIAMVRSTFGHDVYCFGKVLLELVTGKLRGIASEDRFVREFLEETVPNIVFYDQLGPSPSENGNDRIQLQDIADEKFINNKDTLREMWDVVKVAKSCIHPNPFMRPTMLYVLKALERI